MRTRFPLAAAVLAPLILLAASSLRAAPPPSSHDPEMQAIHAAAERLERGRGDESYDPQGRRDPFVDPRVKVTERPVENGAAGMLFGEVKLTGITLMDGDGMALFLGNDNVGYTLREGDRFRDGRIIEIDFAHGRVVFQQQSDEPGEGPRFRTVVREIAP